MEVVMRASFPGGPTSGETVDLPAKKADELIAAGYAVAASPQAPEPVVEEDGDEDVSEE